MKTSDSFAIGFLTVIEHRRHGLFGGYLVLNRVGRPLEFHCSAPVKPNRTQQILYGPTLKSFFYGERIGLALIEKSALSPVVVLTDCEDAISLSRHVETPVGWVIPTDESKREFENEESLVLGDDLPATTSDTVRTGGESDMATVTTVRERQAAGLGRSLRPITIEVAGISYRLAVPKAQSESWAEIATLFSENNIQIDLAEPFSRIREAIEEAGKSFRRN